MKNKFSSNESKKILIAIADSFIRDTYSEVLKNENFTVLNVDETEAAKDLALKEKPDIIIADINLGGFELLENLKSEKIPIIIFSQLEKKGDRDKAMELEAKDFITATEATPLEVIRRIKIVIGEQKSYRISILKDEHDAKKLITDLGCKNFKCSECGSDLLLYLIRDLSAGEKHFILSAFCPKCNK